MDAYAIWRAKNDDEVLAAFQQLDDYTEEGQSILREEVERRQLTIPAPPSDAARVDAESEPPPSHPLLRLWTGHYSLPRAYWGWGVGGQLAIRSMGLAALGESSATPIGVTLLGFVSMTYLIIAGVGIWRSADRYTGPAHWAVLAKAVVAANVAALVMRLIYGVFALSNG